MLEATQHSMNCFVTLTYDNDHLPPDGSLRPKDLQDFLKRLRASLAPRKVRFYGVGEYGDQTWRPHYHLCLFGIDNSFGDVIRDTWHHGLCDIGTLTMQSAAYCAGYVTKKMTAKDDPRLGGRHPEFARMSLRPGIGANAMSDVAESFRDPLGKQYLAETGDVPLSISHGKRSMPLGRYLRNKLREELEHPNPGVTSPHFQDKIKELSVVYKDRLANSSWARSQVVADLNAQKIRNLEARAKIYSKKGKI